jgi:hypothetical protein
MFDKFLKRTKTGVPLGLEQATSTAGSVFSVETSPECISPGESIIDPLSAETEVLWSPPRKPVAKEKLFWLRDLLPADFPDARILTFGYDANLTGSSSTGARAKLNFTQYAHELLITLDRELDDEVSKA